jgi:hypothetical protein
VPALWLAFLTAMMAFALIGVGLFVAFTASLLAPLGVIGARKEKYLWRDGKTAHQTSCSTAPRSQCNARPLGQ